jgi:hypothetical protein
MLTKADVPLLKIIKFFADHGLEAGYIVPTETGLKKSILDAHNLLRLYFLDKGVHDFNKQAQGINYKVVLDIFIVESSNLIPAKMSLYRPESKSGDPRIWIYDLNKYARAWNLIAFLENDGKLYVVNASDNNLLASKDNFKSPLYKLLQRKIDSLDDTSSELLKKLLVISKMGFINTLRTGDTGVGMTLETMLGIQANSSKAPDYQGIEIKASRITAGKSKVTLFSQVPDWEISSCKSGLDILNKVGYLSSKTNRVRLSVTNSNIPNAQKLLLKIDEDTDLLESVQQTSSGFEKIASWQLTHLKARLDSKHKRTFWVKAQRKKNSAGVEMFHYNQVIETRSPLSGNFPTLIEIGAIVMDYTLSIKETGLARDHGYLFRIQPQHLDLLFPIISTHQLE